MVPAGIAQAPVKCWIQRGAPESSRQSPNDDGTGVAERPGEAEKAERESQTGLG